MPSESFLLINIFSHLVHIFRCFFYFLALHFMKMSIGLFRAHSVPANGGNIGGGFGAISIRHFESTVSHCPAGSVCARHCYIRIISIWSSLCFETEKKSAHRGTNDGRTHSRKPKTYSTYIHIYNTHINTYRYSHGRYNNKFECGFYLIIIIIRQNKARTAPFGATDAISSCQYYRHIFHIGAHRCVSVAEWVRERGQ